MRARKPQNEDSPEINAALFGSFSEPAFLEKALDPYLNQTGTMLITDSAALLTESTCAQRRGFGDFGFDKPPIDSEELRARLRDHLAEHSTLTCLILDMSWGLSVVLGASSFEHWGTVAERLAAETGVAVISLYDTDELIEDQLLAAFRAQQQLLAPSGLYENPYWLPTELAAESSMNEKLGFMLGRVVPDFEGTHLFRGYDRLAARGAAPDWLERRRTGLLVRHATPRWYIHCLGRLRVRLGDGPEVDWRQPGAAPKKTRTLFAYLLNSGDTGVHADQVCELLWQGDGAEHTKRARLHHTIAMLRKVLGGQDTVERHGDYYRLMIPDGSWIDINAFEQLCRRCLSLARRGNDEAALRLYSEAERLYGGDLFADLPTQYLATETEDWILPRRIWLRDMAIRVRYDHSKILRRHRRYAEALDHALKAVALDPTNESANAEAMRVFHAQGRTDAMHRQFRQYRSALAALGESVEGIEVRAVYDELCRSLDRLTPHQRKTKELSLR